MTLHVINPECITHPNTEVSITAIADDIATLDELVKDKRAELNNHKKARDRYQEDMHKCQMRRNLYRDNASSLMRKISELKTERSRYNQLTQEAKANREAVKDRIEEARANGIRDLDGMKRERDTYHQQVVEYHGKAQAIHEEIEKMSLEIDASKKLADEEHAKSIRFKEAADEEHQEFVRCLNELRELQDELPDSL